MIAKVYPILDVRRTEQQVHLHLSYAAATSSAQAEQLWVDGLIQLPEGAHEREAYIATDDHAEPLVLGCNHHEVHSVEEFKRWEDRVQRGPVPDGDGGADTPGWRRITAIK